MPEKLTQIEVEKRILYTYGNDFNILSEYQNNTEPVLFKHNVCGYEFKKPYFEFERSKNPCPFCNNLLDRKTNSNKFNTETYKRRIFELVGDEYTVLGEYINYKQKIKMKHNVCGTEYGIEPYQFIGHKHRCRICAITKLNDSKRFNLDIFKNQVYNLVGDEYTVLGEYINSNTKILIRHNTCGNEYKIRPHEFTSLGHRCPDCWKKPTSKTENKVYEALLKFYPKEKIKKSVRGILNGGRQELDIYIPDKKIAIEYNGLYWHSEEHSFKNKCTKDYHLNKTLECEEKGIRLIHIFEDEWLNKEFLVTAKLKHILGCNNNVKIFARKCFVSEISTKDKNQFLNENHIQGEDKANVKLGLWYPINDEEDRLVAVMTFCKPRKALGHSKESKYDYELSRFATDIEFCVIGAFGKLFKYFERNYEWSSIVTYADRRWSIGNVYEKNNFKLNGASKPNYWYCNNQNRYHRYKFRKSELEKLFPELYDKNLTEFEIMAKTKYYKIWDCGNLVYEYTKPQTSS